MTNLVQGQLNKFRASIRFVDVPAMNVTPREMGSEDMIRLEVEGQATETIPSGYGVVQSPNLYLMATISVPVLKTGAVADTWNSRIMTNSIVGDAVVRDDAGREYKISNCSITKFPSVTTNGKDAKYDYQLRGAIAVNSELTSI